MRESREDPAWLRGGPPESPCVPIGKSLNPAGSPLSWSIKGMVRGTAFPGSPSTIGFCDSMTAGYL